MPWKNGAPHRRGCACDAGGRGAFVPEPAREPCIQRADAGDIAVNFIVLPQFFDEAFNMAGMDNVLSRFLLGELYTGGAAVSYLHFRVREVLPVQNLVENMVWTLVNRQPGARRINQVTMGLLLLQLMHYTECIDMSRNGSVRSRWWRPRCGKSKRTTVRRASPMWRLHFMWVCLI